MTVSVFVSDIAPYQWPLPIEFGQKSETIFDKLFKLIAAGLLNNNKKKDTGQ